MFVHEQTQHTEACMGYVHLCMYMHVCVHMSVDWRECFLVSNAQSLMRIHIFQIQKEKKSTKLSLYSFFPFVILN